MRISALLLVMLAATANGDTTINLGRGPVTVETPAGLGPRVPAPVVILLHGYGASGSIQASYMEFGALVDELGFVYAYPSGTQDGNGQRFWNATDACCNFFGSSVDDAAYIVDLITEIGVQFNTDPRRIYVVGHSNGGFMSYRLACDHADRIAAIASLAGATYDDPNVCLPSEPVAVLQIHGTSDNTILYGGGNLGGVTYPGAVESVETWASYNGCDLVSAPGEPLNIDRNLPGQETTVERYVSNCLPGGETELWTIVDGSHTPALSNPFPRRVIEWFYTHPKPAACPGDANADGVVDLADLGIILAQFGDVGPAGDLNGDLLVDVSDLAECLGQFGASCP